MIIDDINPVPPSPKSLLKVPVMKVKLPEPSYIKEGSPYSLQEEEGGGLKPPKHKKHKSEHKQKKKHKKKHKHQS